MRVIFPATVYAGYHEATYGYWDDDEDFREWPKAACLQCGNEGWYFAMDDGVCYWCWALLVDYSEEDIPL